MKSAIHPFAWDSHYITHLPDVDKQHLHLVNLINTLAEQASSGTTIRKETVERLFKQLTSYAQYHFDEEERLMVLHRLDLRPIRFHRIEKGETPASAYELERTELDSSTKPLLKALNGLFKEVTNQNKKLQEMNRSLETRVQERTWELQEAMQRLAQTLRDFSRTDDFACRVGGDEFMVLCPNTGVENALRFAQGLLARVNQLRVAAGGGVWEGSVSIGVATNTDDMTTMTDLIKTADEALYAAKAAGKNCVRQSVSA